MANSLGSSTDAAPAIQSRNAFMHFLQYYRQKCARPGTPACVIASEAGKVWSKMPLNDKYCFIQAARSTKYTFRSRDRRMNRVMGHLRKAMASDSKMDLVQLSLAVKQMKLWKRNILRSINC